MNETQLVFQLKRGLAVAEHHVKQLEQSGTGYVSVPEDFLVGRVVASGPRGQRRGERRERARLGP